MKKAKLNQIKKDILFGTLIIISEFILRFHYLKNSQYITCNESSAWGIIGSQILLKIIAIILITMVLYLYIKEKNKLVSIGWLLVFLGGISNLSERIVAGCITDYWEIVSWWPMFNLADVLIVFGVFLIVINFSRTIEKE